MPQAEEERRMSQQHVVAEADAAPVAIHLLDVGKGEYGDAILCQFGAESVLIDGGHSNDYLRQNGHPSIPEQIAQLLNQPRPYRVSLLIVTHAHQDHIGCLPNLVANGYLTAEWALVADPGLGWGRPAAPNDAPDAVAEAAEADDWRVQAVIAALRE